MRLQCSSSRGIRQRDYGIAFEEVGSNVFDLNDLFGSDHRTEAALRVGSEQLRRRCHRERMRHYIQQPDGRSRFEQRHGTELRPRTRVAFSSIFGTPAAAHGEALMTQTSEVANAAQQFRQVSRTRLIEQANVFCAMAAWSAKVVANSICLSVNSGTLSGSKQ